MWLGYTWSGRGAEGFLAAMWSNEQHRNMIMMTNAAMEAQQAQHSGKNNLRRPRSSQKMVRRWSKHELEIYKALFSPTRPAFDWQSQFYQKMTCGDLQKLLTTRPHQFKRCMLKMERQDLAYARPLDDPNDVIIINGRDDIGSSFPDDEVCVEISTSGPQDKVDDDDVLTGKVVGLMHRSEECCVFICKMEGHDQNLVMPVNKNMTKIKIIQDAPNKIDIRKFDHHSQTWCTEELKDIEQDQLLIVKVLKWENNCRYPLGVVINVISHKDYLKVKYEIEFAKKGTPPSVTSDVHRNKEDEKREDLRDIPTFTIDSDEAVDLDDAISVVDMGDRYMIAIHTTDVASHVSKDSDEDKFARRLGKTFYPPAGIDVEPAFMFSRELSSGCLSLLPGEERKTISLKAVVNKATNEIESADLSLSCIRSDKRFSYKEADRIIEKHLDGVSPLTFGSLEDCIAVAYRFTEVHRHFRLQGSWSSRQRKGDSRSHCMVEELMIFYNSEVAEKLISSKSTENLTPLRCHFRPDPELLENFTRKYSALLPLSPYLSHICKVTPEDQPESEQIDAIQVLTPVFERMEALARKGNPSLVHLIISDEIHPTLRPMAKEFNDIQSRSEILRSSSTLTSRLGHYGLQLNAYTWASSPMRRYIDLILQRLLHMTLSNHTDVEQRYDIGTKDLNSDEDHSTEAESLIIATASSSRVVTKLAVVEKLSPEEHEFKISLLLDRVAGLTIAYTKLKVAEQPEYDDVENSIRLFWKRRVYSFSATYKPLPWSKGNVIPISVKTWREIISAVKVEEWDRVSKCLLEVREEFESEGEVRQIQEVGEEFEGKDEVKKHDQELRDELKDKGAVKTHYSTALEHFKEWDMKVKLGEVVQVQLGTDLQNGATLTINLLSISPSFEVCLEHARNPVMCFSTAICRATKQNYHSVKEYQQIWGDLCQVDTAYNTMDENNSVILEDVDITWASRKGFFQMTETQRKEWSLDFELANCFLCIRLRNQRVSSNEESETQACGGSALPDLQRSLPVTWVAHGVPIQSEDQEKRNKKIIQVHFEIKYTNMQPSPPMGSKFTVELIPKNIPSLLREQAVANIKEANSLVQNIAVGKSYSALSVKSEHLHPVDPSLDLQTLNTSQKRAVQEALRKSFTLIQGPPGTGKTVVGVHITYQFYMKNKVHEDKRQTQTFQHASSHKEIPKKHGILYCGPSNKAVDIVAEQLLKLRKVLKPLRVHGDQMEMQEFPFPGSELRLSCMSLRYEKPKEELRDITLMYLVRKPENPYASEINALERVKSIEEFDQERYRKVLRDARIHELQKHDVILCTCSSAQKHILKETMDFRQIIIDECAMATEPDAFIPLVAHNPQQIVLLGDHKQLQPIVRCQRVRELGMKTSLFERYMKRAMMLDTQYRMHESICEFPSKQFYEGKLKTDADRGPCYLLNKNNGETAILFGHIEGEEVRLAVSTAAGNEKSVANKVEAEQAVRVAKLLIRNSRVNPKDIAILSPYNAQVCTIKQIMKEKSSECKGLKDVCVCTVMKSQGSEWPYVIVSTVRSCPLHEIQAEPYPSGAWLGRKLGFITDPNQVNVAITRAQDGLCILGNRDLLKRSHLWERLLSHYQKQNCVVDPAKDIRVKSVR